MAEPLKNRFGPDVPKRIAQTIAQVHPKFDTRGFTTAALDGYEALELMPRARHIASALHRFLPEEYARAGEILIDSLGAKLERSADNGMAPFFYLPHVLFVAAHGLDHFELSMRAQYELTQRFTAEFSIRPYLIPSRTHAQTTRCVVRRPQCARAPPGLRRHATAPAVGNTTAGVSARPATGVGATRRPARRP